MDFQSCLWLLATGLAVGLVVILWKLAESKFEHKFGKETFINAASGTFLIVLSVALGTWTCSRTYEQFECSHKSGQACATTRNIFGTVVEKQSFNLDEIESLKIQGSGSAANRTYSLIAKFPTKEYEIPRSGKISLDNEKLELEQFLNSKNAPDFKQSHSNLDILWWMIGTFFLGMFLVCGSIRPNLIDAIGESICCLALAVFKPFAPLLGWIASCLALLAKGTINVSSFLFVVAFGFLIVCAWIAIAGGMAWMVIGGIYTTLTTGHVASELMVMVKVLGFYLAQIAWVLGFAKIGMLYDKRHLEKWSAIGIMVLITIGTFGVMNWCQHGSGAISIADDDFGSSL